MAGILFMNCDLTAVTLSRYRITCKMIGFRPIQHVIKSGIAMYRAMPLGWIKKENNMFKTRV